MWLEVFGHTAMGTTRDPIDSRLKLLINLVAITTSMTSFCFGQDSIIASLHLLSFSPMVRYESSVWHLVV